MNGIAGEDFVKIYDEFNQKHSQLVGESNLVRHWVNESMGSDFLDRFSQFEEQMPLVVRGQGFVASHAAPGKPLTREQIDSREKSAYGALSWTENRGWQEDDAELQAQFQGNLAELGATGSKWLVGHRNVEEGNYRSQLDGQLIQINDPTHFVMAVVPADGQFKPDRDVVQLATE